MNRRLRLKRLPIVTVLTLAVATVVSAITFLAEPSTAAATCSNGYVALTFDDGPNSNTNTLLNVLKTNGVRATFFNVGTNAKNNPALVTAENAAGMWIGNHSWSHPHLTQLSSSQMTSEISQTQQAIQQITGSAPQLFRPPYGETNSTLRSIEAQYGLTEVLWSVDSQDWNGASTSQIVQAAGNLTAGGVILMHDGYANTNAAIPQIVTNLASRGLCAGMISTATGRAVAPSGSTPPTGTCTATYTPGTRWSDRFNGQVAITGATSWIATVTVANGQKISATWNGNATWGSDPNVMTVTPNGSGNTFGFTVLANGNFNAPAVSCRAS
ncbi:MAG TPA: polysaccharide deacetylase family protein [Kineosporiaceae bacterium]|nr:polysaccharide deacetylase family protein [Kineosporiaceae bacterium]